MRTVSSDGSRDVTLVQLPPFDVTLEMTMMMMMMAMMMMAMMMNYTILKI